MSFNYDIKINLFKNQKIRVLMFIKGKVCYFDEVISLKEIKK